MFFSGGGRSERGHERSKNESAFVASLKYFPDNVEKMSNENASDMRPGCCLSASSCIFLSFEPDRQKALRKDGSCFICGETRLIAISVHNL